MGGMMGALTNLVTYEWPKTLYNAAALRGGYEWLKDLATILCVNDVIATRNACHTSHNVTVTYTTKQFYDASLVQTESTESIVASMTVEMSPLLLYLVLVAFLSIRSATVGGVTVHRAFFVPAVVALCGCAAHHAVEWRTACYLNLSDIAQTRTIASQHWRLCWSVLAVQVACWRVCVWNKLPARLQDVVMDNVVEVVMDKVEVSVARQVANANANEFADLREAIASIMQHVAASDRAMAASDRAMAAMQAQIDKTQQPPRQVPVQVQAPRQAPLQEQPQEQEHHDE